MVTQTIVIGCAGFFGVELFYKVMLAALCLSTTSVLKDASHKPEKNVHVK